MTCVIMQVSKFENRLVGKLSGRSDLRIVVRYQATCQYTVDGSFLHQVTRFWCKQQPDNTYLHHVKLSWNGLIGRQSMPAISGNFHFALTGCLF